MKQKSSNSATRTVAMLSLSILAGLAVFFYTSGVETRVKSEISTANVYVVTQEIPLGTSVNSIITSNLVEKKAFPIPAIPTDALTEAMVQNNSKVALYALHPGQVLLMSNFGETANNTGALQIPNGKLAVTLSLPDPAHVASFIQPGSQITIYASGQDSNAKFTRVLIPATQVLAVGTQVVPNNSGSSSSLITVLVSPEDSKRLIFATQNYSLYFGLRTDGVSFGPAGVITDKNLFN